MSAPVWACIAAAAWGAYFTTTITLYTKRVKAGENVAQLGMPLSELGLIALIPTIIFSGSLLVPLVVDIVPAITFTLTILAGAIGVIAGLHVLRLEFHLFVK